MHYDLFEVSLPRIDYGRGILADASVPVPCICKSTSQVARD